MTTKVLIELMRVIEGVLFAASDPLTIEGIAKVFPEERRPKAQVIRELLTQLQKKYEKRGIVLVEVASGFRFQVANDVAPYIAKTLQDKPSRYSRALLETLALIAYRQPITRGEIEDIRGVVVNTYIIKTLEEHEWIRVVGHKDVPGKPALYATTKAFLDHFGLKSLDELPPLAEIKNIEDIFAGTPEQMAAADAALAAAAEGEAAELPANQTEVPASLIEDETAELPVAHSEETSVNLAEEALAMADDDSADMVEVCIEEENLAQGEAAEIELAESELTEEEIAEAVLSNDELELTEEEIAEAELSPNEFNEADSLDEQFTAEQFEDEEDSDNELTDLLEELEQDIDETVDEER